MSRDDQQTLFYLLLILALVSGLALLPWEAQPSRTPRVSVDFGRPTQACEPGDQYVDAATSMRYICTAPGAEPLLRF